MAHGSSASKKGFFGRLKAAFPKPSQYVDATLDERYDLRGEGIRVALPDCPLELVMGEGEFTLHLCPELSAEGGRMQNDPSFILFDPNHFFSRISGFLRLNRGDHLILGREDEMQREMFGYPQAVPKRQLSITHDGEALLIKGLAETHGTQLRLLQEERGSERITLRRRENLRTLREIFGGPIGLLPPEEALSDLLQINDILAKEPLRPENESGMPGGVVSLPKKMIPIILGDLHAQVENLLTVLSHGEFLEMMGDGKAAMVLLGDAVHSEMDGQLEEMESSLLIMDLIFRLKLWFPQQVFYVKGNHDSFSEEIGKAGVPQGLLWAEALTRMRGPAYKEAMERFYELLPYVALSKGYVACHAAPPKSKVTMEMLVNVHSYPSLMEELTCNRLYQPSRPAGYTKGDVKRFRNTLKLDADAELFVGHTPLTRHDTLWLNVGGIEHHDVVFSGNIPWIGLFTRVDGHMIPLRYRSEPLLPLINGLDDHA